MSGAIHVKPRPAAPERGEARRNGADTATDAGFDVALRRTARVSVQACVRAARAPCKRGNAGGFQQFLQPGGRGAFTGQVRPLTMRTRDG